MKVSGQLIIVLVAAASVFSAANAAPPSKVPSRGAGKAPAYKPGAKKTSAAGAATPGASTAFNAYADKLRLKMVGSWVYPDGKNHVTLSIQVAQDGSVSDLTLASTPKNNEAEQKANDAFNSAQPLSSLPDGVSSATITAVFDSQADQWNSKANISVKVDPAKTAAPSSGSKDSNSADSPKKEDKTEEKVEKK